MCSTWVDVYITVNSLERVGVKRPTSSSARATRRRWLIPHGCPCLWERVSRDTAVITILVVGAWKPHLSQQAIGLRTAEG